MVIIKCNFPFKICSKFMLTLILFSSELLHWVVCLMHPVLAQLEIWGWCWSFAYVLLLLHIFCHCTEPELSNAETCNEAIKSLTRTCCVFLCNKQGCSESSQRKLLSSMHGFVEHQCVNAMETCNTNVYRSNVWIQS